MMKNGFDLSNALENVSEVGRALDGLVLLSLLVDEWEITTEFPSPNPHTQLIKEKLIITCLHSVAKVVDSLINDLAHKTEDDYQALLVAEAKELLGDKAGNIDMAIQILEANKDLIAIIKGAN